MHEGKHSIFLYWRLVGGRNWVEEAGAESLRASMIMELQNYGGKGVMKTHPLSRESVDFVFTLYFVCALDGGRIQILIEASHICSARGHSPGSRGACWRHYSV
jgi:hypothetical protein